jgi:hypothetical protein
MLKGNSYTGQPFSCKSLLASTDVEESLQGFHQGATVKQSHAADIGYDTNTLDRDRQDVCLAPVRQDQHVLP